MADFLQDMVQRSRERADRLGPLPPSSALDRPLHRLRRDRFDLIAELKDLSPAEGELARDGRSRSARAKAYIEGGAVAISVLTEPARFAGSLDHLAEVVAVAGDVPVMRKDFLVDVRQIAEARAGGASGILLIAAILDDPQLAAMLDCAAELGMFVLLESFDTHDLERSVQLLQQARHLDRAMAGELLLGINTRNLRSLAVDPERLECLAPRLPAAAIAVAESGLKTPADTARVAGWGYAMGLVGTALMQSSDPASLVADMLDAARNAA